MTGQVHYEVFTRRTSGGPWVLQTATEDRGAAVQTAKDLLADGRAAATKVVKETYDAVTGEFRSVTLSKEGAPDERPDKPEADERRGGPVCRAPEDFRAGPARETIGRLLDDWLRRNTATPFELLHRADLVERLEASGTDLQHAVQKIALPESQAGGRPVHEVMRYYLDLVEKACGKVVADQRRGVFPDLSREDLESVARRIAAAPDRGYRLGGAVAAAVADARGWRAKTNRLLDLVDQAPREPEERRFVLGVLEQPLSEIVGSRAALTEILDADLDLGGALAALARLAAPREIDMLMKMEARVGAAIPPLSGAAARLGARTADGELERVAQVAARRVLTELNGHRRLRPDDPDGEIEILRALAMAMTAASGRLVHADEVTAAFVDRSRTLVGAEFVSGYLGSDRDAVGEVRALIRLCENVAGAANKRQAARWLAQYVGAHRLEAELRASAEPPAAKLALLADLQRAARKCDLPEPDLRPALTRIGELGGRIEAEARLCAGLARAPAPVAARLTALCRLAEGAAPAGPAADQARAEAVKLARQPEARSALVSDPELAARLTALAQGAANASATADAAA